MSYDLVVTKPFSDPVTGRQVRVGTHVSDREDVARLSKSHKNSVVQIESVRQPKPVVSDKPVVEIEKEESTLQTSLPLEGSLATGTSPVQASATKPATEPAKSETKSTPASG